MMKIFGTLSFMINVVLFKVVREYAKQEKEKIREADKNFERYYLMNAWVENLQNGKSIAHYLKERTFHRVVIYGMDQVGLRLYKELITAGIEVKYGIDKNPRIHINDMEVYQTLNSLDGVDVIIVTPTYFFEEIRKTLSKDAKNIPIISLAEIVFQM